MPTTLLATPADPEPPTGPGHPATSEEEATPVASPTTTRPADAPGRVAAPPAESGHPAWCVDARCGGEHYSAEVVVPGKRHFYLEILQNPGDPEAQVSILDGQMGGPHLCVPASVVGNLATALRRVDGTLTRAGARQAGPAHPRP